MKLYIVPGACSLAPHIAALEAGIGLEIAVTDLGDAFRQINPKGLVPALQMDDGTVLTEAPAILQYLGDLRPESGLLPLLGDFRRYRVIEWMEFISSELHKGYGNPKHSDESRDVIVKRLSARFALVDDWLAQQRSGWLATMFSLADIHLFVVSRWIPLIGLDHSVWPALSDHFARVSARPATIAALEAEGLTGASKG